MEEQLVRCQACGWDNRAGSAFCGQCKAPLSATGKRPGDFASFEGFNGTSIRGTVRGFQQRRETPAVQPKNMRLEIVVWSFRIDRHDDNGNRLTPVPVEMRGWSFSGAVSDGDEVEISSGRERSGLRRTDMLMNHTTGVHVHATAIRTSLRLLFGREARQRSSVGTPASSARGIVRGFQQSQQQPVLRLIKLNTDKEIWHFRLERHDDEGNRLPNVPVEMRGWRFSGAVANGDDVEVHGSPRNGTLRARAVWNHTTQSKVRAVSRTIVLRLIFLGIIVCIVLPVLMNMTR
ncbi:hypothetical protein [Acrocarpospora catenulata]|uniref:hypothetical protein n=1 Tax=Acrocarpospora catenulata TaxID=2836182 RepID=UPI001BD981F2|nr:hypothetical protein [Acrocarpospora catenulata]